MSSVIPQGKVEIKYDTTLSAYTNPNDILTKVAKGKHKPFSLFQIYCVFSTSSTLSVIRNGVGAEVLNANKPLSANGAYIFSFPVMSGETINLVYGANATIIKLTLWEVMLL